MRSTKTITLTAAVAALPLLAGCGQGSQPAEATTAESSQTAGATQTQGTGDSGGAPSTQGTASSSASTPAAPASSPSPTETRMASAPEATGGQEGTDSSAALPTVADPCAGKCDETTSVTVNHPKFGPMVIVSYELITRADSAPQGKQASYAVYQNGHPVGYVASPASTEVITFGNGPAIGDQLWHLNGMNPVDKYGNVYFSHNSGVTVITPTDKGYDSHGTMPPGEDSEYPFKVAGLSIDTSGEPTVVQQVTNENGATTGKTVDWTWDGSKFVAQK